MHFVESVASNPTIVLLQGGIGFISALLVFLILFATRDSILRTHSFLAQLFFIALVALVPVIGFFIYLLIRPSRTLRERELYAMVHSLHVKGVDSHPEAKSKKKGKQPAEEHQQSDSEETL